ncbi:hypothetical protein ACFL9T_05240 [Thermodesulfobacteriota bacterium]
MERFKKAKWSIMALFLLGGLSLLSAYLEGYMITITGSPKFLLFIFVVLVLSFVTALEVDGKLFVWLLVLGFFIGLLTQMIGTSNNLWIFTGPCKSYVFAGFLWAFAAVTMIGLSLFIKKLIPEIDKKVYNVLALVMLVFIIALLLGEFRKVVRLNFIIYYSALFIFGLVVAYRLRFSALLSLILAAWIMGFVSEYMGSSIGLWKFCAAREGTEMAKSIACWSPPLYLILGCWPLEFLTQLGLSSFLSQENPFE